MTPDAVLDEVRATMARQRKNQAGLATHTGQAGSVISRRLNGAVPLTLADFLIICDWLDVAPDVLLGRARAATTAVAG